MSVRELIESYRREIRDSDLQPHRAAELLTKLTALLGNVLQEIREADMDYAKVLLALLDSEEKANHATIRSKTTPEYSRAQEAKHAHTVVMELIRSLKTVLKAQTDEMKAMR